MVVSNTGAPCGRTLLRAIFRARLRFGFATRFFAAGLALSRFAPFPRAGLEALRDLPRTAERPLFAAARFFLDVARFLR